MARVVHWTDTHVFAAPASFHGVDTQSRCERAVRTILSMQPAPDLVVHGGDSAGLHADHDDGAAFMSILSKHHLDTRIVPGNHDRSPDSMLAAHLLSLEPEGWPWLTTAGGWIVIGLDSSTGTIGTNQISKIDKLIRERSEMAGAVGIVVFIHHHVASIGWKWLDELRLTDADAVVDYLNSLACQVLVLSGHVHMDTRKRQKDISFITTPAVGYQFAEQDTGRIVAGEGYLRVLDLGSRSWNTSLVELAP